MQEHVDKMLNLVDKFSALGETLKDSIRIKARRRSRSRVRER